MNTKTTTQTITLPRSTMTLRVDHKTLATLDMVARSQRRTRSALASLILEDTMLKEVSILNGVTEGRMQLSRGEGVSHEVAMEHFDKVLKRIYNK